MNCFDLKDLNLNGCRFERPSKTIYLTREHQGILMQIAVGKLLAFRFLFSRKKSMFFARGRFIYF